MKAVMYHYVREVNESLPYFRFLDIENFRKQLDWFDAKYGFVTFDEWCRYVYDGSLPSRRGKVLLTFDDAMSCHYRYVFPELKARGLWGIFYVPTAPYTDGRVLDVHRIHLICGACEGRRVLECALGMITEDMIPVERQEAFRHNTYTRQANHEGVTDFKRLLNYYIEPHVRPIVIDAILKELGMRVNVEDLYITIEQIRSMAAEKMLIGSHTRTHPVMSTLSAQEQADEIESSFQFLSTICKEPLRTYCHPYGGFHSFNKDTVRLLNECHVDCSFNVEGREIDENDWVSSIQHLPRFDCNEFQFGIAS